MPKKPSSPGEVTEVIKVTVQGVEGFFEKVVTRFGSGAKIGCPKRYLGREVFVVVRAAPQP
jgi:putative transposon-encoded protein